LKSPPTTSANPTFTFGSPTVKPGDKRNAEEGDESKTKASATEVLGDIQAEDESKYSTSPPTSHFTHLDQGLNSQMAHLQQKMAQINLDRDNINRRHNILMSRKKKLFQDEVTTSNKVSDSDIIKLNVRGRELYARRDTLTAVKGSRLQKLFSGYWDRRLLIDDDGYVFMDVDPMLFVKLLEYLYIIKLTSKSKASFQQIVATEVEEEEEEKELLDNFLNFFGINSKGEEMKAGATTTNVHVDTTKGDEDFFKKQQEIIKEMETEVTRQEREFEAEEYFINFFTTKNFHTELVNDDNSKGSRDGINYEIMNLFVNGEIMSSKRSTLSMLPDNGLTKIFSDDKWVADNMIVTKDGKTCVLLELPTDFVK
jgi:K+ channel tetramerisation domain.